MTKEEKGNQGELKRAGGSGKENRTHEKEEEEARIAGKWVRKGK